jgi:hypothetical protein
MDSTNENRYFHLLFPSNTSELKLLHHLLNNYKQQQHVMTPLLKLTKQTFRSTSRDSLSTDLELFIQSIGRHNDRTNVLLFVIEQHDDILRLVEHHRTHWIKFAIIFILLGIEIIQHRDKNDDIELTINMIFKLLMGLSKEVS